MLKSRSVSDWTWTFSCQSSRVSQQGFVTHLLSLKGPIVLILGGINTWDKRFFLGQCSGQQLFFISSETITSLLSLTYAKYPIGLISLIMVKTLLGLRGKPAINMQFANLFVWSVWQLSGRSQLASWRDYNSWPVSQVPNEDVSWWAGRCQHTHSRFGSSDRGSWRYCAVGLRCSSVLKLWGLELSFHHQAGLDAPTSPVCCWFVWWVCRVVRSELGEQTAWWHAKCSL